MADGTLVGSTRVSLLPDLTDFGARLRAELPNAIREPARAAGDLAGDLISRQITAKLGKPFDATIRTKLDDRATRLGLKQLTARRTVGVVATLDDAAARAALDKLTVTRTVKVTAKVDDAAARAALRSLTARRRVVVDAKLEDTAARAGLDRLTAARSVKITADVDDARAKAKIAQLGAGATVQLDVALKQGATTRAQQRLARLGQDITPAVIVKVQQAAYRLAERQLARLAADRTVRILASADTRVAANDLALLTRARRARITADADTRVAADDLALLARNRTARVRADADTAAAAAALRLLTRDRTTTVRVRTAGLTALTGALNILGGGGGGGGSGLLSGRIAKIAAAAVAALPSIASLGTALAQMGPAAALAAPGLGLLASAFGTLKIGLSGVGDAFKAAFDTSTADTAAATSAVRQVETAQRSLATAQRGVGDAERALAQSQRDARQAQDDLSAARRQAARDLDDLNARLRAGTLDQEQATLDLQQAEEDLAAVRSDPAATQLQIQQADLAAQRAKANLDEQVRQQARLRADTAAANKAGVDGSDQVVAAKEKVRAAGEQVAQQERSLQDAHRAVAEAARAVAQAQSDAAAQTSKLDQAMAKLSPNARLFVDTVRGMAPAWRAMKLDVQDHLFAGIGQRLAQVGGQILPTVRTGLTGTADELNTMGGNALTAVSNLEKAGTLRKVFDGLKTNLHTVSRIPGQIVTGFAQLSVAAQPAFDRVSKGAAGAMDRAMGKLDAGLKSGTLTDAIDKALDVAIQFGHVIGDAFAIVGNIMDAASAGGGSFFAGIGAALKEIRRITELPQVQRMLTEIFRAINAIATALAGVLGDAIMAVLPVLATLAPIIAQIVDLLAPVIGQLLTTLGDALMPIAKALGPVLVVAAEAVVALVQALSPILPVIGDLVGSLLPLLLPFLDVLVVVFKALSPVIRIVATVIGKALAPVVEGLAKVFAGVAKQLMASFLMVLRQLLPIIPLLIPVVMQLGKSLGQILLALAPLIPQILMLGVQMATQLLPALIPLLPPLTQLLLLLTRLATWIIIKVVIPALGLLIDFLGAMRKKFQPAIDAVTWLTKGIAKVFEWLYDHLLGHSVIPDIVNGAIRWFTNLWHKGVELFQKVKDGALRIWNAFLDGVATVASDSWSTIRKGFDTFASGLKSAFTKLRDGIGDVWNGIKKLVASPVRFWIDTVYNAGIRRVWNVTAGKIPGVPNLDKMAMPKGLARGGVLPGFSRYWQGDDQLVPMRRGEGVYVSEAMQDPYERARLHAVNQAAMQGRSLAQFRGFAEGGILGGITGVGRSVASGVGKALDKGKDAVRGDLADLAEKALSPVKSGIKRALGDDTGTWSGLVGAAPLGLIDKVVAYIRGKDAVDEGGGAWSRPVNAPFGTRFGARGLMWASGRHTGLDFPARTGTPVRAVDTGRVLSALSGGPYGRHIEISHGHGLTSFYAHMSSLLAAADDRVKRGEQIGRVGATGNTTGPHLHLEARLKGRAVDPMRYLSGDVGGGVDRWRGTVVQALGEVHQSLSNVAITLRRMKQESGGNPRAVNKTDINWQHGMPSVGLMQVIRPTFDAYAGKYRDVGPKMYGVSIDPLANLYASMKYALSTYGSLSRAYGRPGGYARGGIVGGGVRVSAGLRRGAGYATGGIINVGGKRIDTGPLRAAVGGDFLKSLTGTAAAIDAAMTKVATALKNAFKGVKTTLDDKLLAQVAKQNSALQTLAKQRDKIAAAISEAKAFAVDTAASGRSFASMTGLPTSGLTFDAGGILNGLNVRLGQLNAFSKNLGLLSKRGLNKELLQQLIQAGPDGGASYAQALVKATDVQFRDINAAQVAIGKASTAYGQSAADALYDAGSQAGKGFLAGLTAQEKAITDKMSDLAKAIQAAIKKALKIKSPSQVMAALGAFTVQGFARGMQAATPQAAVAAGRMAMVVRSTAAAGVSTVETNSTSTSYGDRHLHYNATTREVASRQSILAALAMDDLLHRPAMVGA